MGDGPLFVWVEDVSYRLLLLLLPPANRYVCGPRPAQSQPLIPIPRPRPSSRPQIPLPPFRVLLRTECICLRAPVTPPQPHTLPSVLRARRWRTCFERILFRIDETFSE